jgi:tRNA-specific 2-thiouridylase
MRHLASPVGAGGVAAPDAEGEAGSTACGDLVRMRLRIAGGRIREAGFLAFGCGAATAAASAACARLTGARIDDALRLGAADLDTDLGGLGPDRAHGPDLVAEAVARALERWHSDRLGDPGIPLARRRVAVAMSGGVDSAVAAMLLRDAGWDVVGVTMRLWHDPAAAAAERSCCAPETVRLARASARALGIPHLTLDAAERFRAGVVEGFMAGYRAGRTPNPCVTCNGEVRFRILAEAAALVGARALATGHYARVARGPGGRAVVARAADRGKDQSYMLARLAGPVLGRLVFPLGDLTKDEVRRLAARAALPAAAAVESQEVCFVGADGYAAFLERHAGLAPRPGPVLDLDGREVGVHPGYWNFTVGQRRGVGVAGPGPRYVVATDPGRNAVVVGPREALRVREIALEDAAVHDAIDGPLEVRVRHRGRTIRGWARPRGGRAIAVRLEEDADGVAPGQTAALYRDGRLVAAGIISAGGLPGAIEQEV